MGTSASRVPLRRIAAAASLGTAAATIAIMAARDPFMTAKVWGPFVALTAAAALGGLRRSVLSQVLSRAVAWLILLPSALMMLGNMLGGRAPDVHAALLTAISAAALLLGRADLHTREARAEFSPVAYRRWFLAGAVSAVTEGIVLGAGGIGELVSGGIASGIALAGVAAMFIASAVGVVRMRAWGVLLGVATSAGMLGAAAASHDGALAMLCALGALPGLLLAAPILAARLWPVSAPASLSTVGHRLAPAALRVNADEAPRVRARVAEPLEAEDREPEDERRLSVG